ncbi:MAG: hypothetical protein GHCLOJNM_01943 [bacterium]|nr:hypothetical protein [bacterium]
MVTLQISLADTLSEWVAEQVRRGPFGTPEEYLASLLAQDRLEKAQDHLENLLEQGLDSGVSEIGPTEWDGIRTQIADEFSEPHGT